MSSFLSGIKNEFLKAHLQYTDNTEPPKLMQVWSAIGCASAAMGRHVWLPFGAGDIYPNMYILLVGAPGTRKSTAIKFASKLLLANTNVKIAPDDTAGQRQGLIEALIETPDLISEEDKELVEIAESLSVDQINSMSVNEVHHEDLHTMFIIASEFGSVIGQNNLDLTRFLNKVYDGEPYHYRIKHEKKLLKDSLVAMLGGTTSTDLASLLPPEAVGQGFMSRMVLVWAAKKEKLVSRPSLDASARPFLEATYKFLSDVLYGPIQETEATKRLIDEIYHEPINIPDTRFIYYTERRHTHLLKLALVLAACRRSNVLELQDIYEANHILAETEKYMPDALGEYGLSPLALAKQKMVEFLQHAGQPVTDKVLWTYMNRDMKQIDYRKSLMDLVNAKKIVEVSTNHGAAYVFKDVSGELFNLLAEPLSQEDAEVVSIGKKGFLQ